MSAGAKSPLPGSSAAPPGGLGSAGVPPLPSEALTVAPSLASRSARSMRSAPEARVVSGQSDDDHGVPARQLMLVGFGSATKTVASSIGTVHSNPTASQLKNPSCTTASRWSVYWIR